jgi:hypothetical protein
MYDLGFLFLLFDLWVLYDAGFAGQYDKPFFSDLVSVMHNFVFLDFSD